MKPFVSIHRLIVLALFFSACSGTPKNNPQPAQSKDEIDTAPMLASISNADFEIRCDRSARSGNEPPPEMNYLLVSNKLTTPMLIATEPSCQEITDTKAFNMPEQTAFANHGYYAGGGYYYYGQVQNDTLKIFRQWIEETHPNDDPDPGETTYKLFKTVLVYPDGSSSVHTINNDK